MTRVEFRKFPEGDIVALFPDAGRTLSSYTICASYMHVGQHSDATYPLVVSRTEPATEAESASLREELQRIGYVLEG